MATPLPTRHEAQQSSSLLRDHYKVLSTYRRMTSSLKLNAMRSQVPKRPRISSVLASSDGSSCTLSMTTHLLFCPKSHQQTRVTTPSTRYIRLGGCICTTSSRCVRISLPHHMSPSHLESGAVKRQYNPAPRNPSELPSRPYFDVLRDKLHADLKPSPRDHKTAKAEVRLVCFTMGLL